MQIFEAGRFDVAVIGAGHAGCEAALAAARLGMKTVIFTLSLDQIANMPCNPSIGGTAKGHIVREIDALGGEMGRIADKTMLQSRMLNRGKGPAVHSLRVQSDRVGYHLAMKAALEAQSGLSVIQDEVVDIETEGSSVTAVVTALGARYRVDAAIVSTGTYLRGRVFIGEYSAESGPDGCHPSKGLYDCLARLGLPLRRFKTGTPARVNRDSIDFTKLEPQPGDDEIIPLSDDTDPATLKNSAMCYIAYTNGETHRVIRENLSRSPLFSGTIEGTGPRYCPSIEDKVVRFPDRERHQLFIEPMGPDTREMYLQGMSSSLPYEVQLRFYCTIKGLENVRIMRPAYAIEYDCIDPLVLNPTLECRNIEGLYGAGQFCGTSGYEEAAAQGLMAGINAALKLKGQPPLVLSRDQAYIGVLIDDLVAKGADEPYRMMTSRAEYRLLLRQDNAAARLTPIGRRIGLIGDARWESFERFEESLKDELLRAKRTSIEPSQGLNAALSSVGSAPIETPHRLDDLLRRPLVDYRLLEPFDTGRPRLSPRLVERAQTEIKYSGYIEKQRSAAAHMQRYREVSLAGVDFSGVAGLGTEAREKLIAISPDSVGRAMMIPGVSPADISALILHLARLKGRDRL